MNFITRALAYFSGSLLIVLALLVTFNVVLRYGFGSPVIWADQVTSYFLVYITFLAAPWVLAQRKHITVDILREMLGERGNYILSIMVALAGCLYCLFFTYLSIEEVARILARNSEFRDIITVPQWAVYWTLPAGFILMAIQFVLNGIEDVRSTEGA